VAPAIAELGLKAYPDDRFLQYAHSFGKKGSPPPETSKNFPWCGFMVMRTGWRPDDLHLVFDGCRNTGPHNHQDQMNIVLAAYGSTLLADTGYVGTGFSAPDRAYYISHTRGHNLLKVDDLTQTPDSPAGRDLVGWRAWGNAPRDNYWLSGTGYDYAETRYDRSYLKDYQRPRVYHEPARQERRVFFLKPSTGTPYWVVFDRVEPKKNDAKAHDLQLLFHATPTAAARIEDSGRAARITAECAGLLIHPCSDQPWQASVVRGDARADRLYWQGFVSGGWGHALVPADCAIFDHRGPLPVAVVTVFYPYPKAGAQASISTRLLPASRAGRAVGADQALGLAIDVPGGSDLVLVQREPGPLTRFGELAFDGRIAAVRHDKEGKLTSIFIVDGSRLTRGGKPLVDLGAKFHYVECGRGPGIPPSLARVHADRLSVIALRRQSQ
jgi:hypothetical protein